MAGLNFEFWMMVIGITFISIGQAYSNSSHDAGPVLGSLSLTMLYVAIAMRAVERNR